MEQIYQISRAVLLYIYGFIAAVFMYKPDATGGGGSLFEIISQLLADPCRIQNGILGVLFLPQNAYFLGILVTLAGVFWVGYSIMRLLGGMLEYAVFTMLSSLRAVMSSLRLVRLRRRGYGGYGGYGDGEFGDEFGLGRHREGAGIITGLALVLVGALLVSAGGDPRIHGVVSAIGNLLSGVFMLVVAAFVNTANNIVAIALGVNPTPLCQ